MAEIRAEIREIRRATLSYFDFQEKLLFFFVQKIGVLIVYVMYVLMTFCDKNSAFSG